MSHFGSAGPPDIRDTHSLLVLNITFRTSADDLYPLFDRYGKVVDIFIPRDRRTGESRGFAFVRYKYAEEAQKAIERLDGRNVDGRDMVVQYAKYGRDMETIHRGKITQGSPSKWGSRSRSRSPRRQMGPRSPIRGGKRNFGPPSHPHPSPYGRGNRYQGVPHQSRYRDDYRERDRRYRSRSRERYERPDRHRGRERDRRRSPSNSVSRSRSRSRGRASDQERRRSQSKPVEEKLATPPVSSPSPARSGSSFGGSAEEEPENLKGVVRNGDASADDNKGIDSGSPKRNSPSPMHEDSPAGREDSPAGREDSPAGREDSPGRGSQSPHSPPQRSGSRVDGSRSASPSPERKSASPSPEGQSPFED